MSELIDVIDENGHPTGEIVERDFAHLNGIWHRTAHLWLMRVKSGQIQVLLQKRSKNKESYPGCYDTSSAGHIPAGVDYKSSAIRELKEELGIDAEEADLVFCGLIYPKISFVLIRMKWKVYAGWILTNVITVLKTIYFIIALRWMNCKYSKKC